MVRAPRYTEGRSFYTRRSSVTRRQGFSRNCARAYNMYGVSRPSGRGERSPTAGTVGHFRGFKALMGSKASEKDQVRRHLIASVEQIETAADTAVSLVFRRRPRTLARSDRRFLAIRAVCCGSQSNQPPDTLACLFPCGRKCPFEHRSGRSRVRTACMRRRSEITEP